MGIFVDEIIIEDLGLTIIDAYVSIKSKLQMERKMVDAETVYVVSAIYGVYMNKLTTRPLWSEQINITVAPSSDWLVAVHEHLKTVVYAGKTCTDDI